jgi:phosphatidylserine/phosphatidylglycerophosphate/cardiolipin synthase-like enzyme
MNRLKSKFTFEQFHRYFRILVPKDKFIQFHSKCFIFDDKVMLKTTGNIIDRSLFDETDIEMAITSFDYTLISNLRKEFQNHWDPLFTEYQFNQDVIDLKKIINYKPVYQILQFSGVI